MDILFVVPYVPNLVRVRPYNLIRALSEQGHRLTVLTIWTNEAERADVAHLQRYAHRVYATYLPAWRSLWNCVQVLPSGDPFQSAYSWWPALVQPFVQTGWYDVVHVEHLRGARYGLHFKQHSNLPVVWDSVDCITHLFEQAVVQSRDWLGRWRSRLDLKRTSRYEGWLVNQFDSVLVTSPMDAQKLASLSSQAGAAPIHVLPNGVDLHYFRPDTAVARDPNTLVISGKMSYHANISMTLHLAQDIMPHVWAQRPDVKLLIVGKDPTREIQALGQHPNVTVTGTVDDLRPYLQRASLAVAPITYNAGIQNKVLEAMACATPVVTTPQAISSLNLTPGQDLLVAEESHLFAAHILHLLACDDQRQQIGQAGRTYVETHHNWPRIAQRLEQIYTATILAR